MLDFDALSGDSDTGEIIEPRQIFTTLVRVPRFKFPSANQGEVLDKWFERRHRADNTIKMNTGSGKMLVGLLALQSSLNEKAGPAVYITPDNHLVKQVLQEAEDLGISATNDTSNAAFHAGKSILVVNIDKLVNGKSIFGVGAQGIKIPVGSIIIDDAHACLDAVADQFSIDLSVTNPAFKKILDLFEDDLRQQSQVGFVEISNEDPQGLMLVPFWAWQDKAERVLKILHAEKDSDELQFSWPLLKEVISLSQCVIGGKALQIKPRCLPIDQIPSLSRAKRKIYMTATLADDGVLITHLQANLGSVVDPVRPKGAGEIGDRMIIAPQEFNPDITDADVRALAVEVAKTRNVVVLVPSFATAKFWENVAQQTLHKENITAGLSKLKAGHVGLTVLINRYDGVDLPEDACRLLLIHGLPEVYGLIERIEGAVLEGTQLQLLRQIQRLEQGMGRGVRSGEDRCAVLLMGARLTHRINIPEARSMFTAATLAQIEMGKEVTRQLKGKPISELRPILNLCIERNTADGHKWWQAGRARLAKAPEGKSSHIETAVPGIRKAFDLAMLGQFEAACGELQQAVNLETEPVSRGYLRQQLAEYMHKADPVQAQKILLTGIAENPRILRPMGGISYAKITSPAKSQAEAAESFMRGRFLEPNEFLLFVNSVLSDLTWDEERTDNFEAAISDLGLLLGFGSQRPDKLYKDGGPDNLWALGGLKFYVIECKSGVGDAQKLISKDHCNQLLGAVSWFKKSYDQSCASTPILIHPNHKFQKEASPSADMRIIDSECLEKLKGALHAYAKSVTVKQAFAGQVEITDRLKHFSLSESLFLSKFTTGPR